MSRRAAAVAIAATVVSWTVLGVLLGNVGLQRLVSGGLDRVLEQPIAMALASLVAFGAAAGFTRYWRLPASAATPVAAAVIVLNGVAAVAAVALVGELSVDDILKTAVVISSLGGQVIGAAAGVWFGRTARDGSARPLGVHSGAGS